MGASPKMGLHRILTEQEMSQFDLDSIAADAPTGYILECDLQYPEHLHELRNDYPMAAEHLTVTRDMLSPYAESLMSPGKSWVPTRKLAPNLLEAEICRALQEPPAVQKAWSGHHQSSQNHIFHAERMATALDRAV